MLINDFISVDLKIINESNIINEGDEHANLLEQNLSSFQRNYHFHNFSFSLVFSTVFADRLIF
jgi:hypothetical protein